MQIVESIKQQLTPFSPGFWFLDGHSVKMDDQARTLLQLDSPEVALEDFLKIIDESSADFLRKFSSSLHGDTLVLKFTMKHSPEKILAVDLLRRGKVHHEAFPRKVDTHPGRRSEQGFLGKGDMLLRLLR